MLPQHPNLYKIKGAPLKIISTSSDFVGTPTGCYLLLFVNTLICALYSPNRCLTPHDRVSHQCNYWHPRNVLIAIKPPIYIVQYTRSAKRGLVTFLMASMLVATCNWTCEYAWCQPEIWSPYTHSVALWLGVTWRWWVGNISSYD